MDKELFEKIKKCVTAVRTVQKDITPDMYFKRDLHFESIDVVDFIFELESQFKVTMTMNELNDYIITELKNLTWDFSLEQVGKLISRKLP